MARGAWMAVMLAAGLSGQACGVRAPAGPTVATTEDARKIMTLNIRLGEGFQNNTVRVRVDGRQVFEKAGVSTDWTISRADAVQVQTGADSVQLEVDVEGGPRAAQSVAPARTPFVEVRFVNGELLLLPMGEEPPML